MAERQVTFSELSRHKTPDDLWIAIRGKVYNVSNYLKHPGGVLVFEEAAGKDTTADFEDANHSPVAEELLEEYRIGTVVKEEGKKAAASMNWMLATALLIVVASAMVMASFLG